MGPAGLAGPFAFQAIRDSRFACVIYPDRRGVFCICKSENPLLRGVTAIKRTEISSLWCSARFTLIL
ncbi:hypothetical protein DT23_01355 [Thioclava indica]|uniref:Uncharacterized protein n=1 Tax=Thioclava indica TaxID=1353528 RepID=A0A074JVG3_9RHOB|nr:hypothetical protein DT23_01355 [Thioclava indica]